MVDETVSFGAEAAAEFKRETGREATESGPSTLLIVGLVGALVLALLLAGCSHPGQAAAACGRTRRPAAAQPFLNAKPAQASLKVRSRWVASMPRASSAISPTYTAATMSRCFGATL